MAWKFNPFTLQLDYYKTDLYSVKEHTVDVALTVSDLKKFHVMDTSGGERAFWLPHADVNYIGSWIILSRKSKADSLLRVWASGTDTIFMSTAGGYLECGDTDHDYSSILLVIIADGLWGNPSFGIWSSH